MIVQERDLNEPAIAVYFGADGPEDGTEHRHFLSTAEAVKFVVEELTVPEQVNASLVFDDGNYCEVEGIIALYKRLQGMRPH